MGANGAPSMPPIRNMETTADIIIVTWDSPSRDEYRVRADSIIHDLMNWRCSSVGVIVKIPWDPPKMEH